MSVELRRPRADEVDDLADLHVRCWRETYSGILDAGFLRDLKVEYRAAIWRKVIADPGMFALVASSSGERIGFVISGPASAEYRQWADGEIRALYLLRAFQGQGLGRRLLADALGDWKNRGGAGAVAMVFSGNRRARGFYEAMGGRAAGEAAITLGGQSLVEIAYCFDLGTPRQ